MYPYESWDPRVRRNEDLDYTAIASQTIEVRSDFVHIPQFASLGLLVLDIRCGFPDILNGTCGSEFVLFFSGQIVPHLFARSFERLEVQCTWGSHGGRYNAAATVD